MTRDRLTTIAVVVALAIALHAVGLTAPAVALLHAATSPAVVTPPPSPVAPSDDGGPLP
jgi:hypothetical protein